MRNFKGIGTLIGLLIITILSLIDWTEKGEILKSVPKEYQGEFVETNEATALGGMPPIKIAVSNYQIVVFDLDREMRTTYKISKVIMYENHIDFHYPSTISDFCIRVYHRKGLFHFYDAAVGEEGLREYDIGVFSKSL